jgi:hypothetical protein
MKQCACAIPFLANEDSVECLKCDGRIEFLVRRKERLACQSKEEARKEERINRAFKEAMQRINAVILTLR